MTFRFNGLIGLFVLAICCWQCKPAKPAPKPWNVLLVTFDTTRADRLGCYGNDRIETPTLDGLAAQGIRFAQARSTNPITAPSHTSIHTGRFPIAHGIRDNGLFKLSQEQVTLAEILKEQGYATAAAIGAFPLSSQFGLDQGFDLFDDHIGGQYENYLGQRTIPKEHLFFDERKAAQVNESVLPWLKDNAHKRFFLWVHYFDPHQPFEPLPPFSDRYADDLYDGEIAYSDSCLGFLLDYLDQLGALDNTLVIMTADHGEGLGDHNELTHAMLTYDSTLHVPLIIRPPAGAEPAGVVVEERVGNVNILPTILDLLGIDWPRGVDNGQGPTPATIQGRSLAPYWRGQPPEPRPLYAENLSPALTHGWGELRVLFEGKYKYIHGPRPELYDLDGDPAELHNLLPAEREKALQLRFKLNEFIDRHALEGVSTTEILSPEVMEQLASLGYLRVSGDGGEVIAERLRDDGVPPQDRVGDINDMSMAKHLLFQSRFNEALPHTERLMKADPNSPTYQELYGSALSKVGRMEEAWALLQRMRQQGKVTESFLLLMVRERFAQGKTEEAVDVLEKFVEGRPTSTSAWALAAFYKHLGKKDQMRGALEKALEISPQFVKARIDLAVYLAESGDREGAEEELLRALKDDPFNAKGQYNYGVYLVEGGWFEDAGRHFQRAVALAPNYLKAHLALVTIHLTQGERAQAETAYATLQRLAPESQETRAAAALLSAP